MIRYFIYTFLLISLVLSIPAEAQSSGQLAFNQAANLFIDGKNEEALQRVNNALQKHPDDPKLQALRKKLEEQQKQQQQQKQEQENKEKQEQENKEGDQQEESSEEKKEQQENSEEKKEGETQEEKDQEQEGKEGEKEEEQQQQEGEEGDKENQPKPGEMDKVQQRLEEMDISPEKARMILEAMKSNEVQYLQQKKRKQSRRSGNNGRPDW